MPMGGFRLFMGGILQWVGRTCAFSHKYLIICWLVALCLQVKCPLTHGLKRVLLRALEILSVSPPFGRALHGIVMRFKHLVDEVDNRPFNFSVPATIIIMGKKTEETITVPDFCLPIPLLPALLCPSWDSCSLFGCLFLFFIIIVFRMNDPIAENATSQVNIPHPFKHLLTFRGNGCCYFGRKYCQ